LFFEWPSLIKPLVLFEILFLFSRFHFKFCVTFNVFIDLRSHFLFDRVFSFNSTFWLHFWYFWLIRYWANQSWRTRLFFFRGIYLWWLFFGSCARQLNVLANFGEELFFLFIIGGLLCNNSWLNYFDWMVKLYAFTKFNYLLAIFCLILNILIFLVIV
jgi:hypothetical protein